jgi:hypothetical protein
MNEIESLDKALTKNCVGAATLQLLLLPLVALSQLTRTGRQTKVFGPGTQPGFSSVFLLSK